MAISSRFSVGIHILTLIETNKNQTCSSAFLASSVNTNPALIRKIMSLLKKANIIHVQAGVAGATLTRDTSNITLKEVYEAVDVVKDRELFHVHDHPNPECLVGRNIEAAISPILEQAQFALEAVLENVTIADIVNGISENEEQQTS